MDPSALSLVSMSQAVTSFYAIMPRISEVRAAGPDSTIGADVRAGELVAGSLVLGMGAILAVLAKSRMPLAIAGMTVAVFVITYEWLLRANAPFERSA